MEALFCRGVARTEGWKLERDFEAVVAGDVEARGRARGARVGGRRRVPRHVVRGGGGGVRRDLLQHLARGLPRGDHRPVVRGPDRDDDVSPDRKLRRERERRAGGRARPARPRRARPVRDAVELAQRAGPARLPARPRRGGRRRGGHPRARAPCARLRRTTGRAVRRRCGRGQPSGESARERIHRRAEPGLHGVVRASAPLLGRRPAGFAGVRARRASRAALQSGRLRLRSEALHPRKPRARRLRRDLRAVGHPGGRGADHGSRRRVPVERPGRPRGRRGHVRPGGATAGEGARVRHLPGAPDDRQGGGRGYREAQVRPPRRQPSRHEPAHAPRGDHRAEPRLRPRVPQLGRARAGAVGRRLHARGRPALLGAPRRRAGGAKRALRTHPAHAREPQRRHGRGRRVPRYTGVLRAVPPGSLAGPHRRPLPVRRVRAVDGFRRSGERRRCRCCGRGWHSILPFCCGWTDGSPVQPCIRAIWGTSRALADLA